jgi:type I restriction enzyme R subunit
LFTDEETGELPDKIEGSKFYSIITNRDTIREVLRNLMDEGIKVNNGDILGKTIIFARDHNHALMIQQEFRSLYPELCNVNATNGVDYCVVIDNKIKYNEVLQREFKNKQTIRIVVSVDMMDTGVDIPEIVNLVFFKKVLSKIKFWQMIGRGTRLCDNLKVISPSKAYFERLTNDKNRQLYDSKQGFFIFDVCNVFPFFKLNPDGKADKSDQTLSLYQKIFLQKVYLYRAMQANYAKLEISDKKFYEGLRDGLIAEVKGLNRNYIGVHANLKQIEKYSDIAGWYNFGQNEFVEVKKHVAPNVTGVIDLESARAFDYLCYKFAATRYYANKDFKRAAKTIYSLSTYLIDVKGHITEVSQHLETLHYIASNEFIHNASVSKVDEIRLEVRDLMRYIDPKDFQPIISDFDDEISSFNDAVEEEVDFHITIDDFKTLEEKTLFLVQSNPEEGLIYEIQNLIKPSPRSIGQFKSKIVAIAKTAEEYNDLFKDDLDLVVFIRKNMELNPLAVEDFIAEEKQKGFSEYQLDYLKELLLFISQNGKFERNDLLREELNFNGIFNSLEIQNLLNDIEKRV